MGICGKMGTLIYEYLKNSNTIAEIYANAYCLHKSAGSDNHNSRYAHTLAGLEFDTPLMSIDDFINRMKHCDGKCFVIENPLKAKGNL